MKTSRIPSLIIVAYLMCCMRPVVCAADATADAEYDLSSPLISFAGDDAVTAGELAAVAAGLGAPVMRGAELSRCLGLISPPDKRTITAINKAADEGEDLFFAGSLEASEHYFEKVIAAVASEKGILAFHPEIRECVFRAYIFYAQIVEKTEGRSAAQPYIETAAAMDGLSPAPEEFPPWICRAVKSIRKDLPVAQGYLVFKAEDGCRLVNNGYEMGTGTVFRDVSAGPTYVKTMCDDGQSPISAITIREGAETTYSPLVLKGGVLTFDGRVVAYRKASDTDEKRLFSDLAGIGAAVSKKRMIVLDPQKEHLDVWIFDVEHRRIVRRVRVVRRENGGIVSGVRELVSSRQAFRDPRSEIDATPWYRDSTGWTVAGIGAAIIGAGAALKMSADPSSLQEPISYGLIATGTGLLGSGIIVLVLPTMAVNNDLSRRGTAMGLVVGAQF